MQENTAIVKGPALQLPETKTELVKEDMWKRNLLRKKVFVVPAEKL